MFAALVSDRPQLCPRLAEGQKGTFRPDISKWHAVGTVSVTSLGLISCDPIKLKESWLQTPRSTMMAAGERRHAGERFNLDRDRDATI